MKRLALILVPVTLLAACGDDDDYTTTESGAFGASWISTTDPQTGLSFRCYNSGSAMWCYEVTP